MLVRTTTVLRTAAAVLAAAVALHAAAAGALAAVPHEVAIARGIELVNGGKYRAALAPLGEALAAAPDNAEALYYAGVARSRLGDYGEAEALLRRALGVDETAEVLFEIGRVASLTGRCSDAAGLFSRAAAVGADDDARKAGDRLLEGCRAQGAKRPWRLALTAGWQHDSNVRLDPDRPKAPPAGPTADDRALAYFSAGVTPLRSAAAEVDLGYALYASRHQDLEDFDALSHRITVPVTFRPAERVRPTLGYALEHTSFGGEKYSLVQTASAGLVRDAGGGTVSEAVAEYRWNTFWDSALFTDNAGRSGNGWSAGARQGLRRGPVDLRLQAFYDRDDADAAYWASSGWRAGAGLAWRLAEPLSLGVALDYQARDYDEAFPGIDTVREDRTWQWSAHLLWSISPRFSAALTASRTINDSNLEPYAYHRTIYGAVVAAGL
jgi:tetratricopeptide (TPR) repeat protein